MRKITRYCALVLAVLGLSTNLVGCSNNSHHSVAIKTAQVKKSHSQKNLIKDVRKKQIKADTDTEKITKKGQEDLASSQVTHGTTNPVAVVSSQLPKATSTAQRATSQSKVNTDKLPQTDDVVAEQFRQALVKQLPNKYSLTELEKVPDAVIKTAINQNGRDDLDAIGEALAKQYPRVLIVYGLYATPQEFRLGIINEMPGVYLLNELEKVPDSVVWSAVQTAGYMGGDLGTIANLIEQQYPQILVTSQSYLVAEYDRQVIYDEIPGYYSWTELTKIADDVIVKAVCATAKIGGDPGLTGRILAEHYPSIILKNDNHALTERYRQIIIEVNGQTNYSVAELAKVPDSAVIDATYRSMNIGSDAGYTLRLLVQQYPNIQINHSVA